MNSFRLPQELPEGWPEAVRYARLRSGYRASLEAAWNNEWQDGKGTIRLENLGVKPVERAKAIYLEELKEYFAGDIDLPFHRVAEILRVTGSQEHLDPIAPMDLFRSSWIRGSEEWLRSLNVNRNKGGAKSKRRNAHAKLSTAPWPVPIEIHELGGTKLWRVQGHTFDRVINAVIRRIRRPQDGVARKRTSNSGNGTSLDYYLSLGGCVCVVLDGEVSLSMLGKEPLTIRKGQAVCYRANWPHRFAPLSDEVTLLDVCASSRSAPIEFMVRPYRSKLIAQFPYGPGKAGREEYGIDAARHLLSHAICSSLPTLGQLARLTPLRDMRGAGGVPNKMVAKLKALVGINKPPKTLDLSEVLEIAHLLRYPEAHFFTPLSRHMEEIINGPFELANVAPHGNKWKQRTVARPGTNEWFIARPPVEVFGRESSLELGMLECTAPTDEKNVVVDQEPKQLGERLIVVLQGKLGVKLGERGQPLCTGTLGVGDALFLRPDLLAHGFWAAEGPVRAIDLRIPYREGRDLPWGRLKDRVPQETRRGMDTEIIPTAKPTQRRVTNKKKRNMGQPRP